ncbi:MAG: flippase-like domain-containing protein [Planctomycetes bacterium]|nr:flippase-like domain-containing protein [Planctomycetota bacterium]
MHKSLRRMLILAGKILLSASLLVWVLRKVQWNEFARAIGEINYAVALVGTVALLLSVWMVSYRWWRLLAVQDIHVSLWEAMRLTWLGTFFNFVVLGTTGGDLVKAYYLSKHTDSKTACLTTVFVDRLLGLTGLTLLSVIMLVLVFVARQFPALRQAFDNAGGGGAELTTATWVAGGVLAGLSGLGAFAFSRRLRGLFRLESFYQRLPIARQVSRVVEVLSRYRNSMGAIFLAMGQTLVVHLLLVAGVALLGTSMRLAIPWYQYIIYVPLIYIIAAVPIVPGGVGLTESFYVTFFVSQSTQASEVLALALLARLVPMFWALPGVIVAMTGPKIPSAEVIQAEMAGQGGS